MNAESAAAGMHASCLQLPVHALLSVVVLHRLSNDLHVLGMSFAAVVLGHQS